MGHLLDIGKESYLQEQGYEWVPEFDAYIKREQWKMFTREYLDDHSFETILAGLADEPKIGQWHIYASAESEVDIHTIHRHYGTPV